MPKKILVLNDVKKNLSPLVEALATRGYRAYCTSDADNCFELFRQRKPELILVSLAALDVLNAVRNIRQNPWGATIPIFFLGNKKEIKNSATAQKFGGDFHFEPPLYLEEIINKVRNYIGPSSIDEITPPLESPLLSQMAVQEPTISELPNLVSAQLTQLAAASIQTPSTSILTKNSDELLAKIEKKESVEASAMALANARKSQLQNDLHAKKEEVEKQLTQLQEKRFIKANEADLFSRECAILPEGQQKEPAMGLQFEAEPSNLAEKEQVYQENEAQQVQQTQRELETKLEAIKNEIRQIRGRKTNPSKSKDRGIVNELRRQSQLLDELNERVSNTEKQHENLRKTEPLPHSLEQKPSPYPTHFQPSQISLKTSSHRETNRNANSFRSTSDYSSSSPEIPFSKEEIKFASPNAIANIFYEAWKKRVSGRIHFCRGTHEKSIFFESGAPIGSYSNQTTDRFEEYLCRTGKIEPSISEKIRQMGQQEPRKIGAYLVAEEQIKPKELFDTVRNHLQEIIFDLFEWEDGNYQFLAGSSHENFHIKLPWDPRALIFEGIRRKYTTSRMTELVGTMSTIVGLHQSATINCEALGLHPHEKQILDLLDGKKSIQDLIFMTALPAQTVYHVLSGLISVDLAHILMRGNSSLSSKNPGHSDSIDARRIKNKLAQVRHRDYFEVLSVNRNSTPYEIEIAYKRSRIDFECSRFSQSTLNQFTKELVEIQKVLDDAHQVLTNPQTKEAYTRHLS